jgi:hypothetical protein
MSARTEELHQPVDFSAAQALAPEQYKAPEMTATFHAGKIREWIPGTVQGPLHETAGLFLNEAVQVPEFTVGAISGESPLTDQELRGKHVEALKQRNEKIVNFYRQLNKDFVDAMRKTEGEGVAIEDLSQAERDYGVVVLRLGSVEGTEKDDALRETAINQAQLVQKREWAPLTTGAQEWLRRHGLYKQAELLRPGSTRRRVQTIEAVVARRMGYQDLREMVEAPAGEAPSVFERYVGGAAPEAPSPVLS